MKIYKIVRVYKENGKRFLGSTSISPGADAFIEYQKNRVVIPRAGMGDLFVFTNKKKAIKYGINTFGCLNEIEVWQGAAPVVLKKSHIGSLGGNLLSFVDAEIYGDGARFCKSLKLTKKIYGN